MKKAKFMIIGCIVLLFSGCKHKKDSIGNINIPPAPKTYEDFMADAETYLNNENNLVKALASYYDAMEINPTADAADAYNAYNDIYEKMRNAEYSPESEFSVHDYQLKLYKQFLEYYDQRCPYGFIFNKPQRVRVNNEARTVDYQIQFEWEKSPKFKELYKCISDYGKESGKRNSYVTYVDFILNNPVEIYEGIHRTWSTSAKKLEAVPSVIATQIAMRDGTVSIYYDSTHAGYNEAPLPSYRFTLDVYERGTDNYLCTLRNVRFDKQFNNSLLYFNNVSERALSYFDNGEIDIRVSSVDMMYGDLAISKKVKNISLADIEFPVNAKYIPVSSQDVYFLNYGVIPSDKSKNSALVPVNCDIQAKKEEALKNASVEENNEVTENEISETYDIEMP